MNTKQTIAELRALIDQLEAEVVNAEQPDHSFVDGQEYYFTDMYGRTTSLIWWDGEFDLFRLSQGNAFHTEDEAEKYAEKTKVLGQMRMLAGDFKPDWKNGSPLKYHIFYDHEKGQWRWDCVGRHQDQTTIYFDHANPEVMDLNLDALLED